MLQTWLGGGLRAWLGRPPAIAGQRPHAAMGIVWGALSGFTSTLVQVGSPPFQIHMLPQRLDKLTLVGTTVIFFAILNVMKIVPYFALGQFSPRNLATSVVLLPLAIATNFLGIWLVRKTPTDRFYRIAYVLMLLIGWRCSGRVVRVFCLTGARAGAANATRRKGKLPLHSPLRLFAVRRFR